MGFEYERRLIARAGTITPWIIGSKFCSMVNLGILIFRVLYRNYESKRVREMDYRVTVWFGERREKIEEREPRVLKRKGKFGL